MVRLFSRKEKSADGAVTKRRMWRKKKGKGSGKHTKMFKSSSERRSSFFSRKKKKKEAEQLEAQEPEQKIEQEASKKPLGPDEEGMDRYNHYNPRTEELVIKGFLAFVFSGISTFCLFYCQPNYQAEVGFETEWKNFMFVLSTILTIPKIYTTTLGMFTFNAIYYGQIEHELSMRRPIWRVVLMAFGLMFVVPLQLPFYMMYLPIAYIFKFRDRHKFLILLVGLLDFFQSAILLPLGYIVIYATSTTEDVFLNTVVVQVFATLDDEFVSGLLSGPETKSETLETYTEEVYILKNGEQIYANEDRNMALADFAYSYQS